MSAYFVAVEINTSPGVIVKSNAVIYGYKNSPQSKKFLPGIAELFATEKGWNVKDIYISCVSLIDSEKGAKDDQV
jgi:hypothetical protein